VFGRRGIHNDVKSNTSLQALHAYDGCDQDEEPEDAPASSTGDPVEHVVVPIGFNSRIIK